MDERMMTERPERPAKRHPVRRFFLFLLILLAVMAVVILAAWRDGTGFDILHRVFSYGGADEGGTVTFSYDASGTNRFAALDEGLAVLSGTELQVLDSRGRQVYTAPVSMNAPALSVKGSRAVAYDVGGTALYVVDSAGTELLRQTRDSEETIIDAALNSEGWLAVTSDAKGAKGAVTVYNIYDEKNTEVFHLDSSERFVTCARVTDDCKTVAAVTLGQENGVFVSSVVFYDLTGKAASGEQTAGGLVVTPVGSCAIANGMVLDMDQQEDVFVTLSENALTMVGPDGTEKASYSFAGEHLREYDLAGEGYSVLLLNRYQSGSVGRLVSVDLNGEVLGQLDIREEVLSVSAADRYIAVLYADRLVIYSPALETYAALNGTNAARAALVRSDGSALLAGGSSAQVFLP